MNVKKRTIIYGAAAAFLLICIMGIHLFPPAAVYAGSDKSTLYDYYKINKDFSMKSYGQLWTDKTVYEGDCLQPIEYSAEEGELFHVIYSVMETRARVTTLPDEHRREKILYDTGQPVEKENYVTYVDFTGEYMEIKKLKGIIYDGKEIPLLKSEAGDNIDIYQGAGTCYDKTQNREIDFSRVIVSVTKNVDSSDIIQIQIPEEVIPCILREIKVSGSGKVEENKMITTCKPVSVIYSVGLRSQSDPLYSVSSKYIAEHTENKKINFYCSRNSGKTDEDGNSTGDAFTQFTPSGSSDYYYRQENSVLYKDKEMKDPVKSTDSFRADSNYYAENIQHRENVAKAEPLTYTGEELERMADLGCLGDENGTLLLKSGTPRMEYMDSDSSSLKIQNISGTAEMVNSVMAKVIDGKIMEVRVCHGNNGKVQMAEAGCQGLERVFMKEEEKFIE